MINQNVILITIGIIYNNKIEHEYFTKCNFNIVDRSTHFINVIFKLNFFFLIIMRIFSKKYNLILSYKFLFFWYKMLLMFAESNTKIQWKT